MGILDRMLRISAERLMKTGSFLSQMVQWGDAARKRAITVRFLVVERPKSVTVDGQPVYFEYRPEKDGVLDVLLPSEDGQEHVFEYSCE